MNDPIIFVVVGVFLLFLLSVFLWLLRDVERVEWQRDEHVTGFNHDHN